MWTRRARAACVCAPRLLALRLHTAAAAATRFLHEYSTQPKQPTKINSNLQGTTPGSGAFLTSSWGEVEVGNETLIDYVYKDINLWIDKPYVTCSVSGRSYRYGEARELAARAARGLLGALRLRPGDRFAVLLPNVPEFAVLVHAAIEAGLIVTFANPIYTVDEVRRQFLDCNVKAIGTIPMFMPIVDTVCKELAGYKGTVLIGAEDDKTRGIFSLGSLVKTGLEGELPRVSADDVCLIPYSSGTTGMPKGVTLTHKNLVTNLKQTQWPSIMKYKGERGHGDTILSIPPFFHIYGFNAILNYNLSLGYHIVSMPKFTPEDYVKCLVKYKPTTLFVVPSLLAFMATHPQVARDHLASVDTIMVGAAPVSDAMLERFLLKCDKSRDQVTLLQGYGMTESSPVTLMTPYVYPHNKVGSVGQLLPNTQARVVSLSTGEMQKPFNSGELLIRGPQVMKGYWNNEAATRDTLEADGWLRTGDVAYYDPQHYFYIVDRTKELIKVKGNQVSPSEIESVIMELSAVSDAAVVGVPDEVAGEVPRAFVVLKPGHALSERQVCAAVAGKLSKYKRLAGGVRFLRAIPRNAAGKIMRNELKLYRNSV